MASKIKVDQIEGSTADTITIPTGQTFTVTDGIPVASGGTGLASFTAGDILYATGATTLAKLTKGTAEQVLAMNSGATAPDWGSVDLTVLPTISVAKGGTNISSFAAGDILYATGATTLTKLVKGSAADVLTMNAGATAPEWAAAAGGGKIGQVVSCTPVASAQTTTSTSFVDVTGVTVAITPAATSSKVLIMATLPYTTPTVTRWGAFTILRDSTNLGHATYGLGRLNDQTSGSFAVVSTYHYLDSPSSTSELTYKVQFRTQDASYAFTSSFEDVKAIITVMEVLA
tara:strand:- start:410 stop:1270 length:861 start_codon:yes stop_codon:yes gene_type:complete